MNTELLKQVIADQKAMVTQKERGLARMLDFKKHLDTSLISVITGVRRSGKSTLTLQLADHYEAFHFISFDDERLIDFKVSDFNALLIEMKKLSTAKVIVLDEVQLVEGWERFVRRLYDEGYKVFVTGSNARLLSSELATHLTGRYLKTELYPFSFQEYLAFLEIDPFDRSSDNTATIHTTFDHYLHHGGFPEYLKTNIQEVLKHVYDDIIYRDLIVRFGIRNVNGFKNLARYLFTNFTSEAGYLPLAGLLGFNSATSVKDYMNILQEGYLIFEVHKYDPSLKRQYQSNRKIFVIDNGLRNTIAFRTSADNGKLLENLVFLELNRRHEEVWYFRTTGNRETDFLVKEEQLTLIQVCYDLSNPKTRKRELDSLISSMLDLKLNKGLILTYNEEEIIESKAGTIQLIPAWRWLLGIS
jgi:uncharacterized protein